MTAFGVVLLLLFASMCSAYDYYEQRPGIVIDFITRPTPKPPAIVTETTTPLPDYLLPDGPLTVDTCLSRSA